MSEKIKWSEKLSSSFGMMASKLTANPIMQTLMHSFLATMVVSLGVAGLSVLVNFPINAWQSFLVTSGIGDVINGIINVTLNMMSPYVAFSVGYNYAKETGENPITGAMISFMAFLIMIPISVVDNGAGGTMKVLELNYLGSKGLFVAMLVGLFTSIIYVKLSHTRIKITLPESVPPAVAKSFEPILVAMLLTLILGVCKYLANFLPGGNLFNFIANVISTPLMGLAATPLTVLIFYTFTNLMWWCGIHPSSVNGVWLPIYFSVLAANSEAYTAGQPLPYLLFAVLTTGAVYIGGQGNTLALACLTPFGKSERYKSLSKFVLLPNLFNINEPVVFGFPLIMNPYYFIPMVFSSLVAGLAVWGLCNIGFMPDLNPIIRTAWAMPVFINSFLSGGLKMFFLTVVAFVIQLALYFPFFRMADQKCLEEEKANAELLSQGKTIE